MAPGVKAFLWALFFSVYLWLGMLAVGVSDGTAFIGSAFAGVLIFLFVSVFGQDDLGPPDAALRPPRIPSCEPLRDVAAQVVRSVVAHAVVAGQRLHEHPGKSLAELRAEALTGRRAPHRRSN